MVLDDLVVLVDLEVQADLEKVLGDPVEEVLEVQVDQGDLVDH